MAVELIQKEGVNKIIAVGGDGTVHEVVNGIHQSGRACMLGHVAAGSGNDFLRGHGLSNDPEQAIERIMSEKREKVIDLLQINGRLAVNSVGAGFDGQVAKTTNEASYKKWLNRIKLGKIAYLWSVIRVLFTYRPCQVKLTVDGEEIVVERAWLITIANIPNYGGGMLICPKAVADDGMAEICVVNDVGRWGLLRAFPQIFTGAHVNHPKVSFYRGQKIGVEAQRPLFVHADGEIVAQTPMSVEVVPKSLRICG